jgi:hypothetical protein
LEKPKAHQALPVSQQFFERFYQNYQESALGQSILSKKDDEAPPTFLKQFLPHIQYQIQSRGTNGHHYNQ